MIARYAGLDREALVARLREDVAHLDLAERFTLLDALGVYHHPESRSGGGSTAEETRALRAALPELVARHRVSSLLDAPCGDFAWMRTVELPGVDYLGIDVVADLIAANSARHGGAGRRFAVLDVTRGPLPGVDLVLCRDLLIHLSNADVLRALATIRLSGSRLLLASHFAGAENLDVVSGDFRAIDLTRAPFHLPLPAEVIDERSALDPRRSLALWSIAALPG